MTATGDWGGTRPIAYSTLIFKFPSVLLAQTPVEVPMLPTCNTLPNPHLDIKQVQSPHLSQVKTGYPSGSRVHSARAQLSECPALLPLTPSPLPNHLQPAPNQELDQPSSPRLARPSNCLTR
jgi:hypothetical protein